MDLPVLLTRMVFMRKRVISEISLGVPKDFETRLSDEQAPFELEDKYSLIM